MKFILYASTIAAAFAARPQLSVQVRDGNFDGFDGLDPSINWSTSGSSGEFDLECGVDVAARPTADIASLPRSIWGRASTQKGDWNVAARAEVSRSNLDRANIEVNADNSGDDLSLRMFASAGSSFNVERVEATKGFSSGDARVTVNPRFNVETRDVDVTVGYDMGRTNVVVDASRDEQNVRVSQQLDEQNRVAPSFALRSGKVAVEWQRSLGDDNSLTTTLRPNEEIEMEWKDEAWTANINMPIEGNSVAGANVSVKREVSF